MKQTSRISKIEEDTLQKRGSGTNYALILAGIELFGEYGPKGTTTRMLADHANTNISSIKYHFESKEGLYLAVIEYITDRISQHSNETELEILQQIESGSLTKDDALVLMKKIVVKMANLFVESEDLKQWAKIILREQTNPTEGFDILYNKKIQQNHLVTAKLIATYTGLDCDSAEVKIRWHTFFGQILVFAVSNECLLRNLGVKKLDSSHISLIYKTILAHLEACLKIENLEGN